MGKTPEEKREYMRNYMNTRNEAIRNGTWIGRDKNTSSTPKSSHHNFSTPKSSPHNFSNNTTSNQFKIPTWWFYAAIALFLILWMIWDNRVPRQYIKPQPINPQHIPIQNEPTTYEDGYGNIP